MTKTRKLTGYHVLFMLLAFFGVMIVVNVIFTVFAVKSFPGEQVEKSYVQGLNYNQTLEARERQAELGWTSQIGVEDDATGEPRLIVIWEDASGNGITQMNVKAVMTRPASETGQIEHELQANGPGRYELALGTLEAGMWNIEITATAPDETVVTARKTLSWTP